MRKTVCLLMLAMVLLLIVPAVTYAVDQTEKVSGAASTLEFRNASLQVYPLDTIDMDNPQYNLCRVTVTFRTAQMASAYERYGDTVNFFIKSSRDTEIAWVDKNNNDDYEKGEELDSAALGSVNGAYVKDVRLSRSSTVTFYVGSRMPGSFNIMVYTDNNGQRGQLIGSTTPAVEEGSGLVLLTATSDYKGLKPLGGHTGSSNDPFEVVAGSEIGLRVIAKSGNYLLAGKTVTYKMYSKASGYVEIGTEVTGDDGIAVLAYEIEKAGLYSFQAFVDGQESEEMYIRFVAGKAGWVDAKTADGTVLPQRMESILEFYVTDAYGNPVDSKGQDVVEFSVSDEPKGSKYFGFQGRTAPSDENGVAIFAFEPDMLGTYTIRCKVIGVRAYDTIDVKAVYYDKTASLNAVLKRGEKIIPSVKYTDSDSDGIPDAAGRLEIKLVNKDGAAKIAKGYDLYSLDFAVPDSEVVFVEEDGSVIVKDKEYTGIVPVTIYDRQSQVSATYRLRVAGVPASLKQTAKVAGKKADVTIQYTDKAGNETYYSDGEEYTVILPDGLTVTDIKDFDETGKATFVINAGAYKTYDISVITKESKLSRNFSLKFEPLPEDRVVIGAKKVVMFIGLNSYTQDNIAKTSDVAPFIKEGRTFVAIRPVADAFGAEIEWDQASQTVTLTRPDLVVKIVIGSNSISVVKEGEATTVTADVPAFIQDGRTVLPFRAVGEAFGAAVNYDPDTRAVSYAQ